MMTVESSNSVCNIWPAVYGNRCLQRETVPIPGSFGVQGSVLPARREELKKVVSRV